MAGPSPSVVILQHVANENAGTILGYLKKQGISFQEVRLFEKDHALPPLKRTRALVVMGGPMNVYEEDKCPFLKEENRFIRDAVRERIPYLGICLGAQLLAKALGARVYKAAQPEVGWDNVRLSGAAKKEALFRGLDAPAVQVLQWHEDTFDLPEKAVHLASSEAVPNQAYGIDGLFYGFQFHIEVDRAMLGDWFKDRSDVKQILSQYDDHDEDLKKITDKLYENFFRLSQGSRGRTSVVLE